MKFVVNSTYLLKQLSNIYGVLISNPIVPILENFLFEINKDTLSVTASDLYTTMETDVNIQSVDSGSVAIPGRILLETLKNLSDQPITFEIDKEGYGVTLRTDNGYFKLSGENAIDYPKTPSSANGSSIALSSEVLARAIGNTLFATSNDDLRPAMTGVLVALEDKHITFASTDSHRLVRYRRNDLKSNKGTDFIVPRKALNLLKGLLSGGSFEVGVNFNRTNAQFDLGNTKLTCRLIDEKFPLYEAAIPTTAPIKMTIDRSAMLGSLKRILIYANRSTNQTRLKIMDNQLTVSAEDLDFEHDAKEQLTCEHIGEDIEIGFNGRFLIEVLNNIDSEKVTFNMSEPNKAALITPSDKVGDDDLLMLVMPVMLIRYA